MNYATAKTLTDIRFKRLVGVKRTTFNEMLRLLNAEFLKVHCQGGRKPKLSMEDILLATLQYLHEYRPYEQIALDFGIHESNLVRRSHWVEETLLRNGFSIPKYQAPEAGFVIVDVTEIRIERPQKNK